MLERANCYSTFMERIVSLSSKQCNNKMEIRTKTEEKPSRKSIKTLEIKNNSWILHDNKTLSWPQL